jgi:beta-lactamase regulating signal transducer with metallopeptidase domain
MSRAFLGMLADTSIRAFAAAVLVAAALAAVRARTGVVRHAAWTAVLFAMLLMPVLTHWTPTITIPFSFSIPALPEGPIKRALEKPEGRDNDSSPTNRTVAPALRGTASPSNMASAAAENTESPKSPGKHQSSADFWLLVACAIYGVVAAVMMMRFLVGWWGAARIVRVGEPVKPSRGCLPFLKDGEAFDIRQSRLVAVPVTVGLLRQTILLPMAWRGWPTETLRAALAHEAAHVRRRDVLVAFVAHLNRCLFWFHPLSWWLERTLAATAEQAADEAALLVVGNRAAYASILIEMARGVVGGRGRVSWFGIGIDGGRGLLNMRIESALRDSAPQKVSAIQKAIVTVTCLAAILISVACRPSTSSLRENTVAAHDDRTLASRLAWFLWNSGPDDELVAAASSGKLTDTTTLDQQVRRMLHDERANALVNNVLKSWLFLHNLRNVRPDPVVFPAFDDSLRAAFQRETELFLESQLREDRGALELLTANYTFINEQLARHYHISNVSGSDFRRVTLDSDSARRGLLGQGSILAVTSYSTRTSPVLRGKFIVEVLLGTPTTAPTVNMPRLHEDEPGKPTSLRSRMELQEKDPRCARCHAWIDPLGFALENFDAVGQWRTTEGSSLIDSSAAFPDGTRFDGPGGVRQYLVGHREQFVRTLVEQLMTYALGHGGEYTSAIHTIMNDAAPSDYRWSSLILGIVHSKSFQSAP